MRDILEIPADYSLWLVESAKVQLHLETIIYQRRYLPVRRSPRCIFSRFLSTRDKKVA